jgi:diguanylate cyclase (GGDEF)-like protein
MTTQTALTIILGILVIYLAFLLITRTRREKRQAAIINLMSISEFADFLRTNSVDGTILVVAGKVSQALKTAFGCDRIVFLRKQRGFLELNYYHGISRFDRGEYRVRFTPELATRLRESFSPQPLSSLKSLLSESVYRKLEESNVNLFFPIFWRDNLYGVYFINSTMETTTPGFALLVANLAHSLSAAYHVKWHESRYEKLQQRLQNEDGRKSTGDDRTEAAAILKLIRHRTAESLVPRLVEAVQNRLNVPRVALFYEPREKGEELQIARSGFGDPLTAPSRSSLRSILHHVTTEQVRPFEEITGIGEPLAGWLAELKHSGLKYLTAFPLSDNRAGLLALSEMNVPGAMSNLENLRPAARALVDNAESFEEMEALSFTDSLTGLANQRYFRKRLDEEIDRARRHSRSLALVVFDLDALKGINDQYGHLTGDAIIRGMGSILRSSIRAIDIIARYGGDEFCVIMPESDVATCRRFMERLQARILEAKFHLGDAQPEVSCTISQGGAVFPLHGKDPESLFRAADLALLRAKEQGRNQFLIPEAPPVG